VIVRTLTADRGDAGRRLDLVLRRHLTDLDAASRTRVQAWIEQGHVTVNGAAVRRVSTRAALGDLVSLVLPLIDAPPPRPAMAPEDVSLRILFEDDHLLALDKPAGIVVHPTYKHPDGTLMNALLWHARRWPAGQRPSLVGRLDKLTSGVVLVAKTAAAHAALQQVLSRPESEKDYLAVVYGRVNVARGAIALRLRTDRSDRRRVVASPDDGAPSLTRFERLKRVTAPRAGLALLRCRLVTGRLHQIRVHLSARGWPIVGDAVYGEPRWSLVDDGALGAQLRVFPRQALHAWRLAFTHPIGGARIVVHAAVPRDMAGLLAETGLETAL
jgi:23S rRNA pseudouridine1911/1915/1917 synthase